MTDSHTDGSILALLVFKRQCAAVAWLFEESSLLEVTKKFQLEVWVYFLYLHVSKVSFHFSLAFQAWTRRSFCSTTQRQVGPYLQKNLLSSRPIPSDKAYDSWPQRAHRHLLTKNIGQIIWKVLYYSVNTLQQTQKERRDHIWWGS